MRQAQRPQSQQADIIAAMPIDFDPFLKDA